MIHISNEFAHVTIRRDDAGNGPRLLIEDHRSGARIFLDALELETLAWSTHADLAPLHDPGHRRWRDGPPHEDSAP
jgi:hypothetical protein